MSWCFICCTWTSCVLFLGRCFWSWPTWTHRWGQKDALICHNFTVCCGYAAWLFTSSLGFWTHSSITKGLCDEGFNCTECIIMFDTRDGRNKSSLLFSRHISLIVTSCFANSFFVFYKHTEYFLSSSLCSNRCFEAALYSFELYCYCMPSYICISWI